jgi:hypothetical protein
MHRVTRRLNNWFKCHEVASVTSYYLKLVVAYPCNYKSIDACGNLRTSDMLSKIEPYTQNKYSNPIKTSALKVLNVLMYN